jgi:hypothetical protein
MSDPKLAKLRPIIKIKADGYGISLADMHPHLRCEIEELLDWKTGFRIDRKGDAIRPVTAKTLLSGLCCLTGYIQRIQGQSPVESLSALVTQQNVVGFVNWVVGIQKVQGGSVFNKLSLIHSALRGHPRHSAIDLTWLPAILSNLPTEKRSRIDDRKDKKRIPYAEADQIPGRIRALRLKSKGLSPRDLAISVHNELLMLWLVIISWRQRNIRECRIMGDCPNLYLGPLGRFSCMTKPNWLKTAGKSPDSSPIWQIQFSLEETKTKNEVKAFLPRELGVLLEEFLLNHRKNLLVDGEADPGTLFVNKVGKALDIAQLKGLVQQLTSQHAGVAVNPHLYRDIVDYEWLATHPEDYLTVSKLLWHSSVTFTIKVYGSRFDESTGIARMDDWRASRLKSAA